MKPSFIFLSLIFIFSCTVQKRNCQNRSYVFNKNQTLSSTEPAIRNNSIELPQDLRFEASLNEHPQILRSAHLPIPFSSSNDSLCDIITLQSGKDVAAKVLEVNPTEIKYKKCNSLDGPLYVVNKSDIFMIKYSNGTKEVFNKENYISEDGQTVEKKKSKEELEHIRQCDENSKTAHRVVFILGGLFIAAYIGLFVLLGR